VCGCVWREREKRGVKWIGEEEDKKRGRGDDRRGEKGGRRGE
jgi:hypothetical protein